MRARPSFSLLAALVLLSPLAAVAAPACGPSQHCPMAGAMGDGPPCHGTAIQADNCCLTAAGGEPAAAVRLVFVTALATDDCLPAPRIEPEEELSLGTRASAPPVQLFRLFRSLLI